MVNSSFKLIRRTLVPQSSPGKVHAEKGDYTPQLVGAAAITALDQHLVDAGGAQARMLL
jgi:hypothetical protein